MTYAEFKRLDTYTEAESVQLVDEYGVEIDDSTPEEELEKMDVNGYWHESGHLTIELGESIEEFL